jgi:hypothetical protein
MEREKEKRKGPLSKKDKLFISENAGRLTPTEIAKTLNRTTKSVVDFMKKGGYMKFYVSDHSTNSLSKTPYWRDLVQQFSEEELKLIDFHWKEVTSQFKEDIQHTEKLQILDMLKMEVLSNRSLTEQANIKSKIEELKGDILNLKLQGDEQGLIEAKEAQIAALYSAYETIGKDYANFLKEKSNIFKALKATREQRYKQIESSKESLLDWVKLMIEDKERRREVGIYMEKMRIASDVEYERLSEYHTYADGTVEKPILNSNTMMEDDEEERLRISLQRGNEKGEAERQE